MWTPDPAAMLDESSSSLDATHRKAICPRQILEQQRRASRQALATSPEESQVMEVLPSSVQRVRDFKAGKKTRMKTPTSKDQVLLFDHFGRQAELVFRPRCGLWRLRDLFEVLTTCRQDLVMAGIGPSPAPEGGLQIPRQEAGWQAMLDSGVAKPAKPYSELEAAEKASAAAELRFGVGCGSIQWQTPKSSIVDEWIEAMPKDPAFETDSLATIAHEEKLVRLWAKGHVEDRHWLAVLRALEECQHVVQQTKGFRVQRGILCVTGSKARVSTHVSGARLPFGLLSAQASEAEAKADSARRQKGLSSRFLMLGNARSASHRPEMARSFYAASAAAIKDA